MIDRHKTGESPPGSVVFEEWGKPSGTNNTLGGGQSVSRKTIKPGAKSIFGINSKKVSWCLYFSYCSKALIKLGKALF